MPAPLKPSSFTAIRRAMSLSLTGLTPWVIPSQGGAFSNVSYAWNRAIMVYFGEDGDTIIVLLFGGDKDSQRRDIQQAQAYWQEYKSHA
jgi:hypothetical protein